MAAGQVTTGFSKPYVALYHCEDGVIGYSGGMQLARGVEVSIEPESSENNNFYADNQVSESDSGKFTGGTANLTVDGLKTAAEKLVMGTPDPDAQGWVDYDDEQAIPDVGVGFVRRVMSGGVTSYIPYNLVRTTFSQIPVSAATQEEEIDWQTEELSATIKRADDAKHTWRKVGTPETTEAEAEAAIKAFLNITDGDSGTNDQEENDGQS